MEKASMRVLLVGIGSPDARHLQKQLKEIGCALSGIVCVNRQRGALDRLGDEEFDIVLLNLSARSTLEPDIVKSLRRKWPYIPIVGLIGSGDDPGTKALQNSLWEGLVESRSDPQAILRAIRYAIRQKWYEDALRDSEERFRLACETSRSMVYDIDAKSGRAILVQGLPLLLGYGPEEELQSREWWFAQIHEDDIREVRRMLQEAKKRGQDYHLQYRVRHRDGSYLFVEDAGRYIEDAKRQKIRAVGSVVDVTQRRQADEALRRSEQRYHDLAEQLERRVEQRTADLVKRSRQLHALAAQLTQAEEHERKRLAQAIHDNLQQLLVGAKFCTETLAGGIPENARLEILRRLNHFLNDAIASSRSLAFELSPPLLHNAGLARSLHWLARHMETKHGLRVEVKADDQANPADEDLGSLLFQAVRELLFNVVKHAQVRTVELEMSRFDTDFVRITVADAGVGFDPGQLREDSQQGFGLNSIRGRLDLVGGKLEINSAPGSGSRITLTAPLGKLEAREGSLKGAVRSAVEPSRSRGELLRAGRKKQAFGQDKTSLKSK
jgi:PAS domain S-box-containing protein